jgi:phage terminase large subunit
VLIFNPTKRNGFAADSQAVNRRDWVCVQWSGRTLKEEKIQSPGRFSWFNAEAQDVLIRKFGDDSDFVRIRVDGLPPRQASDTLIGYEDVMAATERVVETLPGDPLCIAIDVAGADGGDKSIDLSLRGPLLVGIKEYTNKKTNELADLVAAQVKTEVMCLPAEVQIVIGVDIIGIGRGVYENLTDIQLLRHVSGVDVSELPIDPTRFHRLRDQIYWELREAFVETREISLRMLDAKGQVVVDDELIGQLVSIKWAEVKGKIKVQGKGSESGIPGVPPLRSSPDKMDALAIAWFLYKHRCSRMPAHLRRQRREARRRPVSWKVR